MTFENLLVWKKSRIFINKVYVEFKNTKDFSFKDQIQRASVSIMNKIAEGYERDTDKDLRRFLFMAKGSCSEVRFMLYLAVDFNYLSKK